MRLTILAIAALAAYEYDKKQVRAGKPSILADLRNFVEDLTGMQSKQIRSSVPANSTYSAAPTNYGAQARTGE